MSGRTMQCDRHTVVWTAAVVVFTGGFLLLVTRPQLQRIDDLNAAVEATRIALKSGQNSEQLVPRLQDELQALSKRAVDFEAAIPQGENLGSFLEALARSAQEHNLRAEVIEPGQPLHSQQLAALPIRLKVCGPFPEVFAFVRNIEAMPRLTQVERFTASLAGGSVSAEMRLRIFFRAS